MGQFKDLYSVIRSLRYTILVPFAMILLLIASIWILTMHDLRLKHSNLVKQELLSTSKLFESILSQQLKIVATSPDFIRFMQSGEVTRKNMEIIFLRQISKLYSPMLTGMSIKNSNNSEPFNDGKKTNTHVTLVVCYLNGSVNDKFGDCDLQWTLYFNKNELAKELGKINKNIEPCNNNQCDRITLFNNNNFGGFLVKNASKISFEASVLDSSMPTNIIFCAFILILFILGIWIYTRINKIITISLSKPLSETITSLKNGLQPNSQNYIKEFKYLSEEITNYYDSKEKAKIGKISSDVIHDLKPYISCLNELINKNKYFSANEKNKIDKTINEIESMMYGILNKYGHKNLLSTGYLQSLSYSLHDLLLNAADYAKVVCESRNIKLNIHTCKYCYSVFVITNPLLFSRILLNLIQNSIEANTRNINITLDCKNHSIRIVDDGHGIEKNILEKIGNEKITHGKLNGHGIGLFETKKTLQSWGGSINIDSLLHHGTKINLYFKKSLPVPTFIPNIIIKSYDLLIIIDDDKAIHRKWASIINQRIKIVAFFSPEDFLLQKSILNTNKALFLVDQQFSQKYSLSGINFIIKHKLTHQAILVTSNPNDDFVINECISNHIKILPKNNISIAPLLF